MHRKTLPRHVLSTYLLTTLTGPKCYPIDHKLPIRWGDSQQNKKSKTKRRWKKNKSTITFFSEFERLFIISDSRHMWCVQLQIQSNRVGLHIVSSSLDSSQITSSNTVRTHPPEEWENKRRAMKEEKSRRRGAHFLFLKSCTPPYCHGNLKASNRKESACARGKSGFLWGEMYSSSWGQGFPLHCSSPLCVQYYKLTWLCIHSEHKAPTIPGLLHIQMPGKEFGNKKYKLVTVSMSVSAVYVIHCVLHVCFLFYQVCILHPCQRAILRPSRSWGQAFWISVTLLHSIKAVCDWLANGLLVEMRTANR